MVGEANALWESFMPGKQRQPLDVIMVLAARMARLMLYLPIRLRIRGT